MRLKINDMQYITQGITEDQIRKNISSKAIIGDKYFDKHGKLQPGYANQFEIRDYRILALLKWGQENSYAKKNLFKKNNLRFVTYKTFFNYEVQILVSMMHWDNLNKLFKSWVINNYLKKKGTTFDKLCKKAALMEKEQARLFDINKVKVRIRKTRGRWCWDFLAATHIQRWWLHKTRKFRIYKNIYQLIDGYSVPGGFTAKYFGEGKSKYLFKIQENIMKKVEARRVKCAEFSKNFLETVFQEAIRHRIAHYLPRETVYSFSKYKPASRWADDGGIEPYLCESCATTDRSYPGGGRSSDNLSHPRWKAQCGGCGKKNPYHKDNWCKF